MKYGFRFLRKALIAAVLSLLLLVNTSHLVTANTTANSVLAVETEKSETGLAVIRDPSGVSKLIGQVKFFETDKGLVIEASINNAPAGYHGFHIHEFGSCENAGNAAGGHFNPDRVKHGNLISDGFDNAHAGDLANILVTPEGTASFNQTFPGLTLSQGQYSIASRAIIIHAQKDDFSQPTGNAGGRIGCGTIQRM